MWTWLPSGPQLSVKQSKSQPAFTQHGEFVLWDPLVQNARVHSRITYKNWCTEGRKSVSNEMEVRRGHPSEVRHPLWGTKSHSTTRLLICSTGIQKTALVVFLSGYGSSLQGNHWPVIKEEEQMKIPLSKARGWVGCCVCQVVTIYNILSSILSKRQSNISVEKACLA